MREEKQKVWYNSSIEKKMVDKFKKVYPVFDENEWSEIAKEADFNEFSLLCTVVKLSSFSGDYFKTNYEQISKIRDLCNKRVNEILNPDVLDLFNSLLHNHELWGGDTRYQIFAYGLPTYEAITPIVTAIIIYHDYWNKPITNIKEVEKLTSLMHGFNRCRGDGIYFEGTYAETSTMSFEQQNKRRQIHCENIRQFARLIFNGKYDEAYSMIIFD